MLRKTYLNAFVSLAIIGSATATAGASPINNSLALQPIPISLQAEDTAEQGTLLNINKATAAELSAVMVGVGVKRAEDIIKLREQLGGYTELEQLLDVKGIGLKTLEKNKALISIN